MAQANGRAYAPGSPFESPTYRMAIDQLRMVALNTDIDAGVLTRLGEPKRSMIVSVPIRRDDGQTEKIGRAHV